jgi:hypothetical protein
MLGLAVKLGFKFMARADPMLIRAEKSLFA